jgi:hypothetical protein
MEHQASLTPKESLALITEMMGKTRDNIRQHSFIFLLWGWVLATASILRFLLQTQTEFRYYFLPFPILAATGVIATIVYHRKAASSAQTHLNYFINRMWMVLAGGFVLAVFVSLYQGIEPFTYTLILAGAGTLITGMVMKFRPLQAGGICFLVASALCVFVTDEFKVLIHGAAIIAGYLIPGYMLKNSKD